MLLPTEHSVQKMFAKSAASIALHNFYGQYATLVVFNSTLLCSVDMFLKAYQKNVILGRGTFYPSFVTRIRQYVIFGADVTDIVDIFTWMQRHQFDNTGRYIIICESERRNKCNEKDVVNVLWNYKVVNVVLINRRKDIVNGYTYYQPEDCINTQPTIVRNWDSCILKGHEHCRNMYPLKLKNLHRCTIIVSTFNQVPYMNISNDVPTGADGDLLLIIAKAMNLTLVIMTPRIGNGWGKIEENGTWSGSLADVYNDWANISMTSPCITLSRFTTFQMSTDYAVVTVAWVTHPSEIFPPSLKLLRPFKLYVRIAVGISFIMVVLFQMLLKSKFLSSLRRELNLSIPDDMVYHSWKLSMGLPVSSFPSNKALLCLALFWIWYCFLIRTFYQVCLINSLQTDIYTPEFDTIEEAIASKYAFGGGLALRDYYVDTPLLYDGWKNVESVDINPLMLKLSQGIQFVLAMNQETTNMFTSNNPNKKLHILPQVVVTSPTVMFFKKYSPLANSLNVVLSRLKEAGIIQKIYMDNIGKIPLRDSQDNYIPISMSHYTGCYAIILTGWLLSAVCFVVEKFKSRKIIIRY